MQAGVHKRHDLGQKAHRLERALQREVHQVSCHEAGLGVTQVLINELLVKRRPVHLLAACAGLVVGIKALLELAKDRLDLLVAIQDGGLVYAAVDQHAGARGTAAV